MNIFKLRQEVECVREKSAVSLKLFANAAFPEQCETLMEIAEVL